MKMCRAELEQVRSFELCGLNFVPKVHFPIQNFEILRSRSIFGPENAEGDVNSTFLVSFHENVSSSGGTSPSF